MPKLPKSKFFGGGKPKATGRMLAPLAALTQMLGMGSSPAMHAQAMGEMARAELLRATQETGWNIRGDALGQVARHAVGTPLNIYWDDEDDDEDVTADGYHITAEGTAIIPLNGIVIDAEPSWWMNYLGYASTPQFTRNVRAATLDENVKRIAFFIRSPGGSVSGLADACDAVWEATQKKNTYTVSTLMCSAAMEIGSQTKYRYLTQDGMAGCLGTLISLPDYSGYYEQMGIKMLLIASDGAEAHKGAGTRGAEVTKAHIDDFKRQTNEFRSLFNGIIQRGMGWDDKKMASLADGRTHVGKFALDLGLVDEIATVEAALAAIGAGETPVTGGTEQTPPDGDEDEATDTSTVVPVQDLAPGAGETAVTPPAPQTTDSNTNLNQTAIVEPSPQENQGNPMKTMDQLLAWLKGESEPDAANSGTPAAPANTGAAPEVDPKDAEITRLTNQVNGLSQFRDAQLTQARTDADAIAVQVYKQGTDALKNAQVVINSLTDVTALRSYIQQMEAEKPAGMNGTGTRNSAGEESAIDATSTNQSEKDFWAEVETDAKNSSNAATERDNRFANLGRSGKVGN